MFINNTLSNVYVYQSWENLGTMGVSSRTGVITVIYKKVINKILKTTGPSHSSLDAIIFLLLNISYIILHTGYFRNLKTNQLLWKNNCYTNFLLYVTLLMSNTLNEQLAVISFDSFSQGWLGFYFPCPYMFGYGNQFIHIVDVNYTNIQSRTKQMVSLSNPFTVRMAWVDIRVVLCKCCYILVRLYNTSNFYWCRHED